MLAALWWRVCMFVEAWVAYEGTLWAQFETSDTCCLLRSRLTTAVPSGPVASPDKNFLTECGD